MRIGKDIFKESESFKNVEKDFGYIASKIIQDEKLLKLLSLQENREEDLTAQEKKEIMKKCVRFVPKLTNITETDWSYVVVGFDNFLPNENNPEHRDKLLVFDIICNLDTWDMDDFKIRPYQIAGRLDVLFDQKDLCGTYAVHFASATYSPINSEIAGVTLIYSVTYGKDADRYDD